MSKTKSNFIDSIAPNLFQVAVLILAVVAAFFIGKLSAQVKFYEQNANMAGNVNNAAAPVADQVPQAENIDNLEYPTAEDFVRGDDNAKIAIIEYSDFDCPFCASFHETTKQILKEYPGEVKWIYRHFPLEQLHPESRAKAIASECAALQGGNDAFWAFADEMFGGSFTISNINTAAANIGLDVNAFASCLANEDTASAVDYDVNTALDVGVQATPGGYVVNLDTESVIPLRGAEPIENFRSIIDNLK